MRVAGRGAPRVTAALVNDGEGRLIATPVRKESIAARSKEDLAQEAALVLQQAGSLQCVARDNRRNLPGRFSTLPARRNKKRPELPIDVRSRRGSDEIGGSSTTADLGTPRAKKKPLLGRSVSDAGARKLKSPLARFFSPKLERRRQPVGRSASDADTWPRKDAQRKRSGSESEGSHLSTLSQRVKKQLSPIIETSPQYVDQQPFHFGTSADRENNNRPKKSKKERKEKEERTSPTIDVDDVISTRHPETKETIETTTTVKTRVDEPIDNRSPSREAKVIEHRIFVEGRDDEEKRETAGTSRTPSPPKERKRGEDEVDQAGADSMLHSSRYDLQQRNQQESTIHKMIHRLSTDRSPPPQLPRTMVSPSPGFGHNNNRPFSYTRPNDSCSPPPPAQTNVIYAQVQPDKKKAQRSHSDSDEGLGLDRKDSSRENSPAEKEYRRAEYSYSNDLRRNNEINTFKSRYEEERKNGLFGKHLGNTKDFISRTNETTKRYEFDDIDRRLYDKPEKYTSTVFVDTSGRGRADGMDSKRRDSGELSSRQNESGISPKTSELSARRDLLESRIKSRLLADEMFAAKNNASMKKSSEHEIIDKPIVPSPVTPNRIASPKRYMDTYITETRTNSNGEKYIFEKEIHEDNGKVYGYEKKITNKIPTNGYLDAKPKDGYTVETKTDKYGDKYIVETRTHEGYTDNFNSFLNDRNRSSPEERFQAVGNGGSSYKPYLSESTGATTNHFRSESQGNELSSPIIAKKLNERKFSKSDDFLDRDNRPIERNVKKPFESIRGMSKSTQRLDEVGENARVRALRSEYTTRSHENLTSHAGYGNARRPTALLDSPTMNGRRTRSPFAKRHLDSLREGPNDDYDTDISQMTSSQLESKYYKETRTTQRYTSGSKHPIHDDYDSSPPRIRTDRGGYNSSRYDSDTTARDSIRCDETSRILRKEHRKLDDDPKKPLRRSRNRLDYFDDSDGPRGKVSSVTRLETFTESPTRPPRTYHEGKSRHARQETRGHVERRHRETRLSDSDRKDRLADSGIENDYRRDSQEADRREQLESEDEGFVSRQFIKHERRHTDRNMNLTPTSDRHKYEKYVNDSSNAKPPLVTAKPPTGAADKKYEKKVTKKSGTMSKVKQLFSKKEKKAKEEKGKKGARSGSSGALTDDEVTMRYREYRGDQLLRSAKSARDLGSDINQVRESLSFFSSAVDVRD